MSRAHTVGLDIAKDVFQVHGVDTRGRTVVRKTLSRDQIEAYFGSLKSCLVGLEATSGAHHWARVLQKLGHRVGLMPAHYVKPYVKRNKNDRADAEAICEAVRRPTMRFVPIKTQAQQAALFAHRIREALVKQKVTLTITLRFLLAEFGIVARRGSAGVRETLEFVESYKLGRIPKAARGVLRLLVEEIRMLLPKIKACDAMILEAHNASAHSRLLATIPYIGATTAHAIVATIGDASQFRSSRELSAWIGLVPRQHSSGGKQRLGRISKAGDRYIRRLLFYAARRALLDPKLEKIPVIRWARALRRRKPPRVAAIALASRLARIICAMLKRNRAFEPNPAAERTLTS